MSSLASYPKGNANSVNKEVSKDEKSLFPRSSSPPRAVDDEDASEWNKEGIITRSAKRKAIAEQPCGKDKSSMKQRIDEFLPASDTNDDHRITRYGKKIRLTNAAKQICKTGSSRRSTIEDTSLQQDFERYNVLTSYPGLSDRISDAEHKIHNSYTSPNLKSRAKRISKRHYQPTIFMLGGDDLERVCYFLDTRSAVNLLLSCKRINQRLATCSGFWHQLCKNENFHEYSALKLEEPYEQQCDVPIISSSKLLPLAHDEINHSGSIKRKNCVTFQEDNQMCIKTGRVLQNIIKSKERLSWSGEKFHDVAFPSDATHWRKIYLRGLQMRRNICNGRFELWRLFLTDENHLPVKKMTASTSFRELRSEHRGSKFNRPERRVRIHRYWNEEFFIAIQQGFGEVGGFHNVFVWKWEECQKPRFFYSYSFQQEYPSVKNQTLLGMNSSQRVVLGGSLKISANYSKTPTMKNNLRLLHVGRRISNWRKPINTRCLSENGFGLVSCTSSILSRSELLANIQANPLLTRNKYTFPKIPPEDEKFIIRSPYSEVEIPETNLADFVWQNVDKWPENVALVCGMTGRQYTYEMAHNMSKQFGSALVRMGAKKGDVLAMVVPNIPEFCIAYMGACGVGVTLTTMNPTYKPDEIARQFENSQTKYVLTIGLFFDNIKEAAAQYGKIEKIITLGMEETPEDCLSFIGMLITDDGSLYQKDYTCDPHNDIVVMPYSSGTTGPPKGVELTHYNMVANMCQLMHPDVTILECEPDADNQECTVAVLPFFHIYAMNTIMTVGLMNGVKIVTNPKFEPEMYLKSLVDYKPSYLALVPPLVSFLATHPMVKSSMLDSVRAVTGGAAPFGPALIENFKKKCEPNDVEFREGYGMTESSPCTHVQPQENAVLGGCGHPIPNTIAKIVDITTGAALGPNEDGELCVAGPQVMKGYHDNPKATKKTIMKGWLHTGDIAKYNEDGQFFIIDRLKELIKVKGLQVAPSELEDIIRRCPGVMDVACVGVPDERSGELPRAYIVRKDRHVLEQPIIDFVAERVAPHKRLGAGVMFVETLPKNQTGKVLRRELKAQVFKGSFGY